MVILLPQGLILWRCTCVSSPSWRTCLGCHRPNTSPTRLYVPTATAYQFDCQCHQLMTASSVRPKYRMLIDVHYTMQQYTHQIQQPQNTININDRQFTILMVRWWNISYGLFLAYVESQLRAIRCGLQLITTLPIMFIFGNEYSCSFPDTLLCRLWAWLLCIQLMIMWSY